MCGQDNQPSKDRIQRLESRVEEIFDILRGFVNPTSEASSPLAATQNDPIEGPTSRIQGHQSLDPTDAAKASSDNVSPLSEPPDDVWAALITVYRTRFDGQPIPDLAFQNGTLSTKVWPKCLTYSFLSITVPFIAGHAFYAGRHQDAISLYASLARREIFRCVADGDVSLEVLQSTCMSALREITGELIFSTLSSIPSFSFD